MTGRFVWRMLTEVDLRLLRKFVYNFGWRGIRAVSRFQRRLKRGEFFPAFLFLSVTDRCNLACRGCWVSQTEPPRELDIGTLDTVVRESKKQGSYFFGILGGEPLLHKDLFDLFERHPDCYFLLFTNGLPLTDSVAASMRCLGNVSPLISIEGLESVSDERRGGKDVYEQSMNALRRCREQRLVTGVATSICQSNVDDLATEDFVSELVDRGVHYLWYYVYRPVGPNPAPELALSAEQILELRRFMVDIRSKAPLMVVDAYWDHKGEALCPAAVGISHHIGPAGDIEVCPPIQFACENIGDGSRLFERFNTSKFLADFRTMACANTRGCVLLEEPGNLRAFMEAHDAYDTSGRGVGLQELARMAPCGSHHQPGQAIPEKSLLYRLAKKHWFFGFGAYG